MTALVRDIRGKGQVWTPAWVARGMAAYVLGSGAREVLDPSCGNGALLAAARSRSPTVGLHAWEIDPEVLDGLWENGLTRPELQLTIGDYALAEPSRQYPAIIANPPYLRHHRLGSERKAVLQEMARNALGSRIDARAGLHVYFLVRCLQQLCQGGRLAFIVSADVAEGVFATALWTWVSENFRIEAVIRFEPTATPFPDADTNALVFLLSRQPPKAVFVAATVHSQSDEELAQWVSGGMPLGRGASIEASERNLREALDAGLSRRPSEAGAPFGRLGDYARVVRGIACGANEFFFLTEAQIAERELPPEFFLPCVGRVRDTTGDRLTTADLHRIAASGRPTRLLSLDSQPLCDLPEPLVRYVEEGAALGFANRVLIRTWNPWYRMEKRVPPPLLFAYLGRRDCRFILNQAAVVPLSSHLCVYPRPGVDPHVLWSALNAPETANLLSSVGKSYGGGAVKVEPRALERLPLGVGVLGGPKVSQQALFAR